MRRPVSRDMIRPTWLLPVAMNPTRIMLSVDIGILDSGFRRNDGDKVTPVAAGAGA